MMNYYDSFENEDSYGDGDIPEVDYDYSNSYGDDDSCGCVEPLPESSRPRRDGPGGN